MIVVGAGASGLIAAIAAAEKGASVLIIEQKDKAGKKILATGNGKCNYTNMCQVPDFYRTDDTSFAMKVLSQFDNMRTIEFFERLGIVPLNKNGYIYPNSEQASSIVAVLLMECEALKIDIKYNEKVIELKEPDFTVVTAKADEVRATYYGRKLILATGGMATPKLGSDGSGYKLAKALGHKIIKPLPALVALSSPDKFCRTLSGVRTQAKAAIYIDDKLFLDDEGEIIFTDYGISGIPIMQLSRYASRALDEGKAVYLILDLFLKNTLNELMGILIKRCNYNPEKSVEQMMTGMLNHKLNYILIREAGLSPEAPCHRLSKADIMELAKMIKGLKVRIKGTNTFEFAQVTSGGVSTSQLDPVSLESGLKKGLYITGELLDVDGACGGYNLQWAWSTGYIAGSHAAIS